MPVNRWTVRICGSPICRSPAFRFGEAVHEELHVPACTRSRRVFTQTEEVLRAGLKDNLMPVRFSDRESAAQCQGVIAADPFLLPTKKFPQSISPEEQQAPDPGNHGYRRQRSPARLHCICRFSLAADYAAHRRTVAQCCVIAGRHGAVSERHPQPHHGQQPHCRRDSRDRY